MSELPKISHEANETHHEQVVALLDALGLAGGEDESEQCIFDKEDFGGLLLLNGYERVTVEVDSDMIGVRLVHPAFDDRQDVDSYVYKLADQTLTSQLSTRDYNEQFEAWASQYAETSDRVEKLKNAVASAHSTVMKTIRDYSENDLSVAAAFDRYDKENERIMALWSEVGQSDELDYQHSENEAKMLDLFESVAGDILERTRMLQKYRETLLTIQQLQSELEILSGHLDSIQIVTTPQPADPAEFSRALKTITGLIEQA